MVEDNRPADREEQSSTSDERDDDYSRFTRALTEVVGAIDQWPPEAARLALPAHATGMVLKVEHAAGVLQALDHLSGERTEAALAALDPIYQSSARMFDGQIAILAGAVLVALDRPEEALRRLDQAFSTPGLPNMSLAMTLAGLAHSALGRDRTAAKFFKGALSVESSSCHNLARMRLAGVFRRHGRYERALTLYEEILASASGAERADALRRVGDTHLELKAPLAAIECYRQALATGALPKEEWQKSRIVQRLIMFGHPEEARELLRGDFALRDPDALRRVERLFDYAEIRGSFHEVVSPPAAAEEDQPGERAPKLDSEAVAFTVLRRYFSQDFINSLMASEGPEPPVRLGDYLSRLKDGRQRFYTVLQADVRASTEFLRQLQDWDARRRISRLEEVLTRVVWSYGGAVLKGTGDGLIAFFGWDDPEHGRRDFVQALRCASGMQAESWPIFRDEIYPRLQHMPEPELRLPAADLGSWDTDEEARLLAARVHLNRRRLGLAVGVAFGRARFGLHGHPDRQDLDMIGEVMARVARIEGQASTRQVLTDHTSLHLLRRGGPGGGPVHGPGLGVELLDDEPGEARDGHYCLTHRGGEGFYFLPEPEALRRLAPAGKGRKGLVDLHLFEVLEIRGGRVRDPAQWLLRIRSQEDEDFRLGERMGRRPEAGPGAVPDVPVAAEGVRTSGAREGLRTLLDGVDVPSVAPEAETEESRPSPAAEPTARASGGDEDRRR